ncbi:hypothetical protein P9867_017730 [Acinetobacter baumannii]|uniref:Uncharacterized protein n=1 Tax=Acinetobacter baumannii TaxID=470 RepID=A0AA90HTP6_ACIBA|nr:hypothetical protein [Acinetobacter baumannii]MEC5498224.1 hypothetical protein [Acinetobacter baumannii]
MNTPNIVFIRDKLKQFILDLKNESKEKNLKITDKEILAEFLLYSASMVHYESIELPDSSEVINEYDETEDDETGYDYCYKEDQFKHSDDVWINLSISKTRNKKAYQCIAPFLENSVHQELNEISKKYWAETNMQNLKTIIDEMLDKSFSHINEWIKYNKNTKQYYCPRFINTVFLPMFVSRLTMIGDEIYVRNTLKRVGDFFELAKKNGGFTSHDIYSEVRTHKDMKDYAEEAVQNIPEYTHFMNYLREHPDSLKSTIYKRAAVDGRKLRYLMITAEETKQFVIERKNNKMVINDIR